MFDAKKDDGMEVTFKPPAGNFVCTFGGKGASEPYVYAVCRDGTFFRYAFNARGARDESRLFGRLLKPDEKVMFRLMEESIIPPPAPVVTQPLPETDIPSGVGAEHADSSDYSSNGPVGGGHGSGGGSGGGTAAGIASLDPLLLGP